MLSVNVDLAARRLACSAISGIGWGPMTDRSHTYMFAGAQGATTLSVVTLHALDGLIALLGEFATVGARLAVRRKDVRLVEDGSGVKVTAPDQVALVGTLESGAVVSTFYRGGVSRGENLHWEINGSEGDLVLSSPIGNLQVANLTLFGARGADKAVSQIHIPAEYSSLIGNVPAGPPANVAQLYVQFAQDIQEGTQPVPDFQHALRRHRLIDAIETASETGVTQTL